MNHEYTKRPLVSSAINSFKQTAKFALDWKKTLSKKAVFLGCFLLRITFIINFFIKVWQIRVHISLYFDPNLISSSF